MTQVNHIYPVKDSNHKLEAFPTTDDSMRRVLSKQAEVARLISPSGLTEDPHEGSNSNYGDNDDGD
jgi:hypothetical protein